jgi:hypothetical protein
MANFAAQVAGVTYLAGILMLMHGTCVSLKLVLVYL